MTEQRMMQDMMLQSGRKSTGKSVAKEKTGKGIFEAEPNKSPGTDVPVMQFARALVTPFSCAFSHMQCMLTLDF
jgi:hypothetical protein